jgi:hypothetical protein
LELSRRPDLIGGIEALFDTLPVCFASRSDQSELSGLNCWQVSHEFFFTMHTATPEIRQAWREEATSGVAHRDWDAEKDAIIAARLADIRLWTDAWAEFVPFLDFEVEIRKIICTTNAIGSINARLRRAVNARGHFPNELAGLKCLYLVTRSLNPTGVGRTRWTMRWKPAINAFAITFGDRFPAAETR